MTNGPPVSDPFIVNVFVNVVVAPAAECAYVPNCRFRPPPALFNSDASVVSVAAGAVVLALNPRYEPGACPGGIIHAPAVGVDAAAVATFAGSADASYQRSIVSTEFVADVFDWIMPNRIAPDVVMMYWPAPVFAGMLFAS